MANVLELLVELTAKGRDTSLAHIMALLHGLEPRLYGHCCGADPVQHAEGGEELEQKGAVWFHHKSDASVSAEHEGCV